MNESTSNLNLDQLTPPTPEALEDFNKAAGELVALSEQLGQVARTRYRAADTVLGSTGQRTAISVACTISERDYQGEEPRSESHLSATLQRWPAHAAEGQVLAEPVSRPFGDAKTFEGNMDDVEYAFAMDELAEDLPPESMDWVKRVMAEAERVSDSGFKSFAVDDLLNGAPTAEQLLANHPDKIAVNNVNGYTVPIIERSSKGSRLYGKNGSAIEYHFIEGNEIHWKQHPQEPTTNIQVTTADGRHFMYTKLSDGSESLTVALEKGKQEQTRDDLRAAGATLVENVEDFAYGDDVRHGVQAPNDATLRLMTIELNAAMESGVDERYLKPGSAPSPDTA
jgi:hypothetical protein